MNRPSVVIIGGGLSGLTLHYLLRKDGFDSVILEARDRVGGRIVTAKDDKGASIDLGATWLGPAHKRLQALMNELKVAPFEQHMGEKAIYEPNSMTSHQIVTLPAGQQPSWRIRGGTSALIQALCNNVGAGRIHTGQQVRKISEKNDKLLVVTETAEFGADIVVSTLPPKLLWECVTFEPELPKDISEIMSTTHTWMGESIKFGLSYDHPFWREKESTGTVFSNAGPITEMYDHSDIGGSHAALIGFLNSSYVSLTRDQRLEKILSQLRSYYGERTDSYRNYFELVWANEPFTYSPYDRHLLPHHNNGHEIYHMPLFDGTFFMAGAETSSISPGYMDGAVRSSERVFKQIKEQF
ncbi:flavin monoamine oxidase family protein [Rhodohalobacter sp. 8-1]|uniref:flavin monoamine oxidase family protein n=1 Tax=Rhodohalobacter sp. 8-1 TaxID=3131972 RepID=UPI0030ECA285